MKKSNQRKTVLITGSFDVLHRGHIEIFKYAHTLGDFLIVATDTDRLIGVKKGTGRPFNKQEDRVEMLRSIRYVDEVLVFDTDEELKSICWNYLPDYRIVGTDYQGKEIVGGEFCKEVIYFERIEPHSTTKILNHYAEKLIASDLF